MWLYFDLNVCLHEELHCYFRDPLEIGGFFCSFGEIFKNIDFLNLKNNSKINNYQNLINWKFGR